MPPPQGTPNFLLGPGDFDVTSVVHSDTYPAIDSNNVDLNGTAVFVTGGSKGLGRAIVLSFAKAGASFIAAGARSDMSELAKEVALAAASANKPPPRFLPIKLDVTDEKSVEAAAALVKAEFGRCDIVISNAGMLGIIKPIAESDPGHWWSVFELNFHGAYLVSRYFLPLLFETEGGKKTIINISSVGAHLTTRGGSAYQISKLALLRFSQFLHGDHGRQGLISICIHPGNSLTDIFGDPSKLPEAITSGKFHVWILKKDNFANKIANKSQVAVDTPELCGDSVVFLTSERREWLSGRYVNVTWDMPELMDQQERIVTGDKLKIKFDF